MNALSLHYSGAPLVEKCVNNVILGKGKAFERARGKRVQLRNTKDKDIKEREKITGWGEQRGRERYRTKERKKREETGTQNGTRSMSPASGFLC
jgi:hypothetical protein